MSRKLRAALLVEGELMLTLAKHLAAGECADAQALEAPFAESRALEAGADETLDSAAWEDRDDLDQGRDTSDPQALATATIDTLTQQLALPTLLVTPPPPRSDATTARSDTDPAQVPTSLYRPNAPIPAQPMGAFLPSVGKVVPLAGRLGLTAPPAPPRRRRPPARDQLKLFG